MGTIIIHGDRITARGISFVVDRVLFQDYYGDGYGYDVEFVDTKDRYHHWKQGQDGGQVARWDGRGWRPYNVDGHPVGKEA